jgi:hypothetical protein
VRFRTASAGLAVALAAVLLGPVAPAHAAKPTLKILFTSAESGIVAGNAIWGQKSIQWTGYVAGRPKGSRLMTQTKVAGTWRSIATTDKSVRRTVARGRFFPVLGVHRYRIALLSKKGKLLVASKAWTSTGYATVPLSRVVGTLPPSIGPRSVAIGGYAYPMLWRLDHADIAQSIVANSWSIEENRCRSVRFATSITYDGAPATSASAWFSVGWSPKANSYLLGDTRAKATSSGTTVSTYATVSSASPIPGRPGGYGIKPMAYAWQQGLFGPEQVAWVSGEALFGGVGLCSRVVR